MRTAATILGLVLAGSMGAGALARPGPHTATRLALAPDWISAVRIQELPACPPRWRLHLTAQMPTPGWQVTVDKLTPPDAEGRMTLFLTGTRPRGAVIQVISPLEFAVEFPRSRKNRYLIDVRYRVGASKYRRVHAFVLDAS